MREKSALPHLRELANAENKLNLKQTIIIKKKNETERKIKAKDRQHKLFHKLRASGMRKKRM